MIRPISPYVIGDERPLTIVGRADAERAYFLRVVAATDAELPLDPVSGLGLHARVTLSQCERSDLQDRETDWGGTTAIDGSLPQYAIDPPYWNIDFDRGIYIPRDFNAQIAIVGGDPTSRTRVYVAYRSHRLDPSHSAPPWRLTYQSPPRLRYIWLVDRPVTRLEPLPIVPADVRGASEVSTSADTQRVSLVYDLLGTQTVTLTLVPGAPVSLAGCVAVVPETEGQLVFRIEL